MSTGLEIGAYGNITEALWNIRHVNRKYRIASSQIMLLDNQIKESKERYLHSQSSAQQSYGYALSIRLYTLKNLRKMFFIYAAFQADLLEALHIGLVELSGLSEWGDHLLTDPDINRHVADTEYGEDDNLLFE